MGQKVAPLRQVREKGLRLPGFWKTVLSHLLPRSIRQPLGGWLEG